MGVPTSVRWDIVLIIINELNTIRSLKGLFNDFGS